VTEWPRFFNQSYQIDVTRKKWNEQCLDCIHLGRTVLSIGSISNLPMDLKRVTINCQLKKCNFRRKKKDE
jgi:hypothetical protein